MTLADVQSDFAEQQAVPRPHHRHYLTWPLFFVFAVPSVDVLDNNWMIPANPHPY